MADFTQIIQEINDDITTNGTGAITGAKLNEVLRDMIAAVNAAKEDLIADGYIYGGKVNPNSTPSADKRLFYIAEQEGTYTNFGDIYVTGTSIFVIKWNENTQNWTIDNFGITYDGVDIEITQRFRMLYLELGFDSFSPHSSYVIGDYVTKVDIGGLYRFTSNHSGAWDDNDVEEVTLVDYIDDLLSGKQDVISDLATIRSGAAAGATAYQKPSGGIPKTDLASGVQTSLGKADTAFQKPSGGIPASDLSTAVQTSLGKADTALQTESDPVFSASPAAGITSGDIAAWDAKADPIPVVDASTIPASMDANKVYQYGTLSGDTTFPALATPTEPDIANVYCWTFTTPATAPTITWPNAITSWAGGSAPTINASKSYEVSVMDGLATIIEA